MLNRFIKTTLKVVVGGLAVLVLAGAGLMGVRYLQWERDLDGLDPFVTAYVDSLYHDTAFHVEHTLAERYEYIAAWRGKFQPPYNVEWRAVSCCWFLPWYGMGAQYDLRFADDRVMYLYLAVDGGQYRVIEVHEVTAELREAMRRAVEATNSTAPTRQ